MAASDSSAPFRVPMNKVWEPLREMSGAGRCVRDDVGKNMRDCLPCRGRLGRENAGFMGVFSEIKPEKSVGSYREISKKGDHI